MGPTDHDPGAVPPSRANAVRAALLSVGCAALSLIAAPAAQAHPHAFFGGHAQLEINADNALTVLRLVVIADEFSTQAALYDLGLDTDQDGALTPAEEVVAANGMATGLGAYKYFTRLLIDGERTELQAPAAVTAKLQEGLIAGRLDFTFDPPLRLGGREVEIALYDPTYYVEVRMGAAPDILGEGDCSAVLRPFDIATSTAAAQSWMSRLGAEEIAPTTGGFEVGALFTDRSEISCGG